MGKQLLLNELEGKLINKIEEGIDFLSNISTANWIDTLNAKLSVCLSTNETRKTLKQEYEEKNNLLLKIDNWFEFTRDKLPAFLKIQYSELFQKDEVQIKLNKLFSQFDDDQSGELIVDFKIYLTPEILLKAVFKNKLTGKKTNFQELSKGQSFNYEEEIKQIEEQYSAELPWPSPKISFDPTTILAFRLSVPTEFSLGQPTIIIPEQFYITFGFNLDHRYFAYVNSLVSYLDSTKSRIKLIDEFQLGDDKEIHLKEDFKPDIKMPALQSNLTITQCAILFHLLREHKTILDYSNDSFAKLIHYLTGYSEQNLRTDKGFGNFYTLIKEEKKGVKGYDLKEVRKLLDELSNDIVDLLSKEKLL